MKKQTFGYEKDNLDHKVECIGFLMLSGKLGNTFLDIPKKKRKIEDYGKLMAICIVFEFRRILLKLCKEGESNFDKILEYLQIEGKKPQVVESWIIEAIENILDLQLKNDAMKVWEEKKQRFGKEKFDLFKMFQK